MPTKQKQTITVAKDEVVCTEATPFLLHEADFLRLTKIHSFVSIWAHSFFAGTGVFLITVVAKLLDHKYFNGPAAVTSLEWITLCVLVVLAVIFELLHFLLPSDKKKTIKKIKQHFDETSF
jgi:hypothetical protein